MRTANEIRQVGMEALLKALGPVDAVRFIQQYDKGYGDYTKERENLYKDVTVDQIFDNIANHKNK